MKHINILCISIIYNMIFSSGICPPALIYLIFSISQIVIDMVKGFHNTALMKMLVTIIFTFMLNYLCQSGLGIISWIIVLIPFILMTVIVSMLLLVFNMDPKTGRLVRADKPKKPIRKDLILYHEHVGSHDGHTESKCDKKHEDSPFYSLKLDEDLKSEFDQTVDMVPMRDNRLASYS